MTSVKSIRKLFSMLGVCYGIALFGQVGVNTTTPKATLDVTGQPGDTNQTDGFIAPRITGSQLKDKDDRYTSEQDGAIVSVTSGLANTDTSARTRNVLKKGYYTFDSTKGSNGEWVRMFDNAPVIFSGADGSNAHSGNTVTISAANNNTGTANMMTRTFTVTEKSLVTFSLSVPVTDIVNANGTNLTDGTSKNYGFNMILDGGNFNNYLFARQGAAFANSGSVYTTGIYQLNASRSVVLEPGTYTATIRVYVYARDSTGIRASFGGNNVDTVMDIIGYTML